MGGFHDEHYSYSARELEVCDFFFSSEMGFVLLGASNGIYLHSSSDLAM